MIGKRLHLNSVGIASCGQRGGELAGDANLVTCKFCHGILKQRLLNGYRAYTRQEWTRCRLQNNDVWAQSVNGVLVADDDGCVVVTSDIAVEKRYRARVRALLLATRLGTKAAAS